MRQVADLSATALSYLSGEGLADPYPLYARLRDEAPVFDLHEDYVVVSRHREVLQVLSDADHFLSNHYRPGTVEYKEMVRRNGTINEEQQRFFDETGEFSSLLLAMSVPPEHDRRRRVFHAAFSPQMVARLETDVQEIVDRILASLAQRPEADVVIELGFGVPRLTHMRLLGLPEGDLPLIDSWKGRAGAYLVRGSLAALGPFHKMVEEFRAYIAEVVDARRRVPGKMPFLSTLIAARDAHEISDDELAAMVATVLLTGTESAMSLLITGILTLLRHPEEWQRLCDQPALAPQAVEECLRYETPIQTDGRNVAPGAVLDGIPIRAGRRVLALIGSANRDHEVFDEADAFRIMRPDSRHKLSFGVGPHRCLGAGLARMEARTVFATLADRYPDVELTTDEVGWRPSPMLRAPSAMRLLLGDPRPAARA
jgi:cytochrome P450